MTLNSDKRIRDNFWATKKKGDTHYYCPKCRQMEATPHLVWCKMGPETYLVTRPNEFGEDLDD